MPHYLITGATGFVGSHLVEELLAQKVKPQNITLLIRSADKRKLLPPHPFTIIIGDIRDKKAVAKATEHVEYVYHLAATSGFQGSTDNDYLDTNVGGTKVLLDALKKKRIRKFLFVSTIAVYGLPAWTGPIEGYDETHPHTYSEIYGKSKEKAEQLIKHVHSRTHIPFAIVRPSSVYGPRDHGQLYELYRAIDKRQFMMIGNGKNVMDLVYVKDLVRGMIRACEAKQKTSEYILSGDTPTLETVVRQIAASIHAPITPFHIPYALALPASAVAHAAFQSIGKRSPLFPSRVKVLTTSYSYSYAKAQRELGYIPKTPFSKGASLTGKWYLSQKTGHL